MKSLFTDANETSEQDLNSVDCAGCSLQADGKQSKHFTAMPFTAMPFTAMPFTAMPFTAMPFTAVP